MLVRYAVCLALAVPACGGRLVGADGGPDANGGRDGGGGWGDCSSPNGYAICGGPKHCDVGPLCPKCDWGPFADAASGAVVPCTNTAYWSSFDPASGCQECLDGNICVAFNSDFAELDCQGFELGLLYARAGVGFAVRYADNSTFTGERLPEPATCPQAGGVKLCGGACGDTCGPKEVCTGRSPLHPYSLCLPDARPSSKVQLPCSAGAEAPRCNNGYCFIFKVQPEAQQNADDNGVCMDKPLCQAAASALPGGGICLP